MLIAILIGLVVGIFIPKNIVFIEDIIKFLTSLSINSLLYLTLIYIATKIFLSVISLKQNKISILKLFLIFFLCIIISLLLSVIVSIGFMNLNIFQPDESFSIFQNKAEPIKTYSFFDMILNIVNSNMLSSFQGPTQFILPVIFIALIFGLSAFNTNKKGLYFIETVSSLDEILSKITHQIIEIFPFLSVFVVIFLVRQNLFTEDKIKFLFKPLMAILLITFILTVFYTVFLSLVIKNNTPKFYLGILGAALTGFISGNSVAAIISLNEHLKRNIGVKKHIADFLTPMGMILNKSGTIIVTTITLMTVILGYSPNILDLKLQIGLFFLLFVFSFLLDGINEAGFLAVVSMIMHIPSLHLEQNSYLLFLIFVPILSRIGIFLDILTTGIFITIVAKVTDNIDKKEYIDFI